MGKTVRTTGTVALLALATLLAACSQGGATRGGTPAGAGTPSVPPGAQQETGYASPAIGQADGATQKVSMTLSEMKYEPSRIEIQVGTTVEIEAKNVGKILHDLIIDAEEGELELELQPGQSKTAAVTFKYPGTYKFKCEQPGHSELGMVGEIVVKGEGTAPAVQKTDRQPANDKTPFVLVAKDGGFGPAELTVEARSLLQGQVINVGKEAHRFAVEGRIATFSVPLEPGKATGFGIKYRVPGDYRLRCLQPGHQESGILHVTTR